MEHFEITAEVIHRSHVHLGLFIDSKTPAEIEVRIMAEGMAMKMV